MPPNSTSSRQFGKGADDMHWTSVPLTDSEWRLVLDILEDYLDTLSNLEPDDPELGEVSALEARIKDGLRAVESPLVANEKEVDDGNETESEED